nr:MAG TPA: hypothetical protein [Caudoviricetes sp.]
MILILFLPYLYLLLKDSIMLYLKSLSKLVNKIIFLLFF